MFKSQVSLRSLKAQNSNAVFVLYICFSLCSRSEGERPLTSRYYSMACAIMYVDYTSVDDDM